MEPRLNTPPAKRLKEGLGLLLILLLAFSFFTPRSVEYSDYGFLRATPVLINFFVVPVLVVIILKLNKGAFKAYFLVYGFLAYMGATIITIIIHYKAQSIELDANGISTKAIITEIKPRVTALQSYWQIYFTYQANHRRYEERFRRDKKPTYRAGDTLELIYNKSFPRMYRLTKIY